MKPGDILGHEPMGIVREVGSGGQRSRRRRPGGHPLPNLLWQLLHVRSSSCSPSARPRRYATRAWVLRCSATPSSTARCPAGRPNCCACRRPSSPTSRSRAGRPTRGSSTFPTCCRPRGRRSPTPTSPTGGSVTVLGLGPIGDMAARIASHLGYRVIAVDRVPERLARRRGPGYAPSTSTSIRTTSATSSAS